MISIVHTMHVQRDCLKMGSPAAYALGEIARFVAAARPETGAPTTSAL